jgi:hypothetical protein
MVPIRIDDSLEVEKYFGTDMPEGTAMEVTDRAYTSPIWYTP